MQITNAISFNPRAPRGARRHGVVPGLTVKLFQSTRPARGATTIPFRGGVFVRVSIHAPRAGRDVGPSSPAMAPRVSIHAPRAGRDQ